MSHFSKLMLNGGNMMHERQSRKLIQAEGERSEVGEWGYWEAAPAEVRGQESFLPELELLPR